MFRGSTNPYDEIVVKATDENQTSENWEIILNLCDKVQDEGEAGARNVIAAVLKRLAHRNANVQLYSLALAEALSKNCGVEVHREIASRAFTQGLEKLVTDRTGHDKVKKKTLAMIQHWAQEWENDPSLGIMNECYESLKTKGMRFDQPMEAPPPVVEDDIRRREEEELQRVLELSMQDKGGRQWGGYAPSAGAGSSSRDNLPAQTTAATSSVNKPAPVQPTGGYAASVSRRAVDIVHDAPIPASSAPAPPAESVRSAPKQSAAPVAPAPVPKDPVYSPVAAPTPLTATTVTAVSAQPAPPAVPDLSTATRVRALHNFEPADAGELAFEKGDVIKVVDRTHKDWWKGQLKGRTGIFPVNYVEPMPELTTADLAREAEAEAAVFSQAANIDRLLTMLRNFDINKDNLADNDDIQELYRSSLGVRPKIIRLIEKYNQKKVELAMMNDNFISAKELFDRMMEESLAKSAAYDYRRGPQRPPNGDFRGVSGYWGAPFPGPGAPGFYPPAGYQDPAAAGGYPPQIYPPQMDPAAYAAQQQQQQQQQQQPQYPGQDPAAYAAQQQQQQQQQQYPGQDPAAYQAQQQQQQYDPNAYAQMQQQQQQQYDPNAYAQQQAGQPPLGQQPVGQQQLGQPLGPQPGVPSPGAQQPAQQPVYDPNAYAQQQQQQQQQQQPPPPAGPTQPSYDPNAYGQQQQQQQHPNQGQPGYDPNTYGAHQQTPSQDQAYMQPQPSAQSPQGEQPPAEQPSAGPPYVYDPNGQYPDPNAQAWAQYYAQGGMDPQGAVYFHSVPGVKEPVGASPPAAAAVSVTQPTPTQETHTAPVEQYLPQVQQQPLQQQQQQPPHQQSPPTQTGAQLSPKSPVEALNTSPKSKRISMAGIGTVAQHPDLQSSLPTYAHEMQTKRPSSAGSQPGAATGAATGAHNPPQWAQGQTQPLHLHGRAASPGGGPPGPWAYQPQINEPARTGSASPPASIPVGGYMRAGAFGALPGGPGGVSPGGTFHPASAGPDGTSNQPTPYPTFHH